MKLTSTDVRRFHSKFLVSCVPSNTALWIFKALIVCICSLPALVALQSFVFLSYESHIGQPDTTSGPRKQCKCKDLTHFVGENNQFSSQVLRERDVQAGQYSSFGRFESTCSDEATMLGRDQSVITFSFFYTTEKAWNFVKQKYFEGILENLRLMKKIYPGWVMRVYSNISYTPEVCKVVCSDARLYFCHIHRLPHVGDVSNIHPRTTRFLVIGDPTVKKFAVRDLDSRLSHREKDCVNQWEKSAYPIHGMRDHPFHSTEIMAGMWGADNQKLGLAVAESIQRDILKIQWQKRKLTDQQILTQVIYRPHKRKVLTHDSYLCKQYKDGIPFPTQRQGQWDYVGRCSGKVCGTFALPKCPTACRPTYGKSWEYC